MNLPTTMHVGPTAVHARAPTPERRCGRGWRANGSGGAFEPDVEGWCRERGTDRPEHGLSLGLCLCGGGLPELGSMPWRLRCRSPRGGPADVARRSVAPAGMVHMTSAPYPEP